MAARWWAPAVVALALASCTTGGPAAQPPASPTPAPAGTSASTSAAGPRSSPGGSSATGPGAGAGSGGTVPSVPVTSTPPRRLQFTATARIPLPGLVTAEGLVTWPGHAAWVGCDAACRRAGGRGTALFVADLVTRRVRAIARTPDGDALFPVGGTGALAVYATVTLDRSAMRWSLHRVDVASGVTKRLVSRRVAQDRPPPQAVLDGRRVVWQTFPRRLTGVPRGPLDTVHVVTGRTSRLVDDLPGLLVTVTRAGIVMRAGDPPGAPDDGRVSAAVYVPETGETRVLSPVPVVDGLVADDATAVWQASVTPGYGVWGTPVRGDGTPRQYHDGGTSDRTVGRGFLAVVTAGDYPVVLLYPTAGGPVVALPDVPAEVDPIEAEGSTLTYIALPPTRGVTPDQQQPLTLVTGTVTVPGG